MPYLRGSFSSSSSSTYMYSKPPLSPMSARDELEPIAICGMACRLPGATSSPSALWDLLLGKRTTNSAKVPDTRFNIDAHYYKNPSRPGSFHIPGGYFLDGRADAFDPTFFQITPVEAMWMDPQQRKMLEVCYEALESAGVPRESAAGTNTGVFLGSFTSDYESMTYHDPDFRHSYAATGVDPGIISARVSNVFDLAGPSSTINTACSSSVYAVHSACNSLRARDCDAALVGGVNLILSVEQHMNIAKLGVQSPTSFCHTFDASADGYGRAEGVGVLYIKRLDDALRDGDVVRAVIRSSAVGANGKVPGYGITSPSLAGQERVIRQAYKRADLDPDDTAYVECHGTGTPVGDPIEVRALSAAMNDTRSLGSPLILGAIKPNIGHSEAASGVSAMIKAVMAVESGVIPGVAGLKNLNPAIHEDQLNVRIARDTISSWPGGYKSRRAGVSSFGYGGTNGHVIIENVDALEPTYQHGAPRDKASYDHSTSRPLLVTFSAHDKATLSRNVSAHAEIAERYYLADLAHTLNTRRSKFTAARAYAIASEPTLSASSFSLPNLKISSSSSSSSSSNKTLAFIFTGQGSQWPGAGHQALLTYPVFLSTIRRLDRVLKSGVIQPLPSFSLEEELSRPASTSRVTDADLSQPTLVALELATVDLLASWGITPAVTVGHSAGESAAAYAAGLCSGPEVIIAAYYRGFCAAKYGVEGGGMLAVGLGAKEIVEGVCMDKFGKEVVIACENSPKSVTLSGPRDEIRKAKEVFDAEGIFAREVRTPMAYHSSAMDPVAGPMVEFITTACARLDSLDRQWRYPRRRMVSSSVKGNPVIADEREITPQYWADNLTGRVLFDTAVAKMACLEGIEETLGAVVEVGPHSALAGPFKQIRQGHGLDGGLAYVPTMVRNEDSAKSLLATAGELFLLGYDHIVDLARVNKAEVVMGQGMATPWMGQTHKRAELKPLALVDLPPYQWNYDRTYSAEPRTSVEYRQLTHPRHDLLGSKILGLSSQSMVWRNVLRVRDVPWLVDHRLGGSNMFPAAGHMALAIEAVRQHVEVHGPNNGILLSSVRGLTLRNVALTAALVVPDSDDMTLGPHGGLEIQTRLTEDPVARGSFHFTVSSLSDPARNVWTVHSSGNISLVTDSSVSIPLEHPELADQQLKSRSAKTWNQAFQRVGFSYTRPFNALKEIRSSSGSGYTSTCEIPLTTKSGLFEDEKGQESRYILHPATVDSLLQLCIVSIHKGRARDMKFGVVPTLFDEATFYLPPAMSAEQLSPASSSAASEFDADSGIGITVDEDRDNTTYDGQTGQAIAWNDAAVSKSYIPGTTRKFKTNARLLTPTGDVALDIKGLHTVAYEAALPPSSAEEVDVEVVLRKMEERLPPMPYAGVVWKPDISLNKMIKLEAGFGVADIIGLLNHEDPVLSVLIMDSACQLNISQIVEHTCLTAEVSVWGRDWDTSGIEDQLSSRVVKVLGQEDLDSLTGGHDPGPGLVICSLEDTTRLVQDGEALKSHLSLYHQSTDSSSKGVCFVRQSDQDHFRDKLDQAGFEILNEFAISEQTDSPCVLVLVSPAKQDKNHDQSASQQNSTPETIPNTGLDITILYSPSHSDLPTSLASALTTQGHAVETCTLQDFSPDSAVSVTSKPALTILYNPTGSILAQHTQPDEQVFSSLKRLIFSGRPQGVIWLTSGVNQGSCPSPMGASVSGFLRVIREEDKFVNVKVVDHDLDERVEDVAAAVTEIGLMDGDDSSTASGSEREFWVRDGGIVFISRVVANAGLNAQAVVHGGNGKMEDTDFEEERTLEERKPLRGKQTRSVGLVFEEIEDLEPKEPGKGELDVQVEAVEYSHDEGTDTDADDRPRIVCGRVIAVGEHEEISMHLGTRVVSYIPGEKRHDTVVRLASSACVPCPIGSSKAVADMVGLLATLCKAELDLESASGGLIQGKTVLLLVSAASPLVNSYRLLSKSQRFDLSVIHPDDGSQPDLRAISQLIQKAGSCLIVISSEFSSPLAQEIWRNMPSGASFCCLGTDGREARITSSPEVSPFLRGARFSASSTTDVSSIFQESPRSLVKTLRSVLPAAIGEATSPTGDSPIKIITPTSASHSTSSSAADTKNTPKVLSYLTPDLSPPKVSSPPPRSLAPKLTFSPDGIYLLIGCLGGLGRSLSSWLVSRGARHLYFLSRSGSSSPAAHQLLQSITSQGALPKVFQCDVSNLESVTSVIESITSPSPGDHDQNQPTKIKGIIHAAMVLQDGFFNSPATTLSKFAASLRPKVDGALNLQTALAKAGQEEALDFFISTSSISATVGQPGQSNYAAGNAVLDNLPLRRLDGGSSMTSLVLPMILGVGVVAESSTVDLEGAISKRGMYGVHEAEMLNAFEDVISLSLRKKHAAPQQLYQLAAADEEKKEAEEGGKMNAAVVMGLDPGRLAKAWVAASASFKENDDEPERAARKIVELDNAWIKEDARFRHIKVLTDKVLEIWEEGTGSAQKRSDKTGGSGSKAGVKFTDQIRNLVSATDGEGAGSYEAALDLTARHITNKCGAILMIPPQQFDLEGNSIASYGLDSMVGAELRNWLFKEMGLNIAFQELLAPSLSFAGLARLVLKGLGVPASTASS